jgi:hypothetical protein
MGLLRKMGWLVTGRGVPGPHLGAPDTYKGHEIPAYRVERGIGAAEVRAYPETVSAETLVDGAGDAALGEGFRRLAGYIFGNNAERRKIEMTAPVEASRRIEMTAPVASTAAAGGTRVTFTLPRGITAATAPQPKDQRVTLRTQPPSRQAVLRFTGRADAARMAGMAETLRQTLRAAGVAFDEPPLELRYDDPMTAPWNRRNEVGFRLRD